MTEERKFCRICKNLGIDCEAGTFYCSLSHRPDKLPNTLKCDEFILCDFITRLEQKNKELRREIAELRKDCNHCNFHTYRSALEEIKKKCNWVKECSVTIDNLWEYDEILEIVNEVLDAK